MNTLRGQILEAGGCFVTGTDTEVGKTVAAAALVGALGADYWKPVQAGLDEGGDNAEIVRLAGIADGRIHPNAYALSHPLSPHESARRDGVTIDMEVFELPRTDRTLVVEGAGGLLVPLNADNLMTDLMDQLGLPLVLVARSGLGTINHTLLSLEAIRARGLPFLGTVMCGPPNAANREALETYGITRIIAELPRVEPLDAAVVARFADRVSDGLDEELT